ncbi:Spo0E family sporulation regulatory protein-aspartic acid phosphatase [Bacillus songklensis]|uniref:Spo0E family sporulation regulatory protein-aspartic acid phosphatase n=1 Tax=Bacillus songklensis TaxID=1069116 RepID=A0ABV8AXU5_9BACI
MDLEDLSKEIEVLRRKMITVGLSEGFTSSKTIKISQILDRLINIQMGLQNCLR